MPVEAEESDITEESTPVPQEWLDELQLDADIMIDQVWKAQEDMRFVDVDGGQWEGDYGNRFGSDRTRLELDMVSDAVESFLSDWNENRMGVEFKPFGSKTTKDDSRLINGIYMADFEDNDGKLAVDNAVDESSKCGIGHVKVATQFEDNEDPENDFQRVTFEPVYESYMTIVWDRASKWINKKDARRCVELIPFIEEDFEDKYPGKDPVSAYTPETANWMSSNWFVNTPSRIFVAARYDVEEKREKVFVYSNLQTSEIEVYSQKDHDDVKEELKKSEFHTLLRERDIVKAEVTKVVFSGKEVLEEKRRIIGKHIPFVPFYGYRSYVDGVEHYRGIVRKMKDAGRLWNTFVSQIAENAASNGQKTPIFSTSQIVGKKMKEMWADRNNQPVLYCDPLVDPVTGSIVSPGPVGSHDPGLLDGNTKELMGIVQQFFEGKTNGSTQDQVNPQTSGVAVGRIVKRQDRKTQNIMDNTLNALKQLGEVYQGVGAEVYDSERIVRTLGVDGTDGEEQLFKTVLDEETGRLVTANNLRGKKFKAIASTGPQYETQREQTVDNFLRIIELLGKVEAGNKYITPALLIVLQNMKGTGLESFSKFIRRDAVLMGMSEPESDEEKAMLQAAQQPKEDENKKLIEALAQKETSEAKSLEAATMDKIASAKKKLAETDKIRSEIPTTRANNIVDIRNKLRDRTGTGG